MLSPFQMLNFSDYNRKIDYYLSDVWLFETEMHQEWLLLDYWLCKLNLPSLRPIKKRYNQTLPLGAK